MGTLIYNQTLQAFEDAATPQIYAGGVWKDADGKVYDTGEQAWVDVYEGWDGYSLIPAMTSNTTPSGIVSAGNINGNIAYKSFSRVSDDECWGTNGAGTQSGWLQYEFEKPVSMSKISYGGQQDIAGAVVETTVKASLDGSTWIILGTITLRTPWQNYIPQTLEFSKNIYKFIRIEHPAVNNGVRIIRVQVYP